MGLSITAGLIVNETLQTHVPKEPANTQSLYKVARADLPLSCPTPEMELWNSHPRVYLPIENTGTAQCPYCSACFELED